MLNRRILRIKAFKVLYSFSQNREMTLKDALSALEVSCEATRDLYLFLLASVSPLTAEAARIAEAARNKFKPTEEELHPNLKFVHNSLAPLLDADPDFQKLLEKKNISWDQYDVLIHNLYESIRTRPYFTAYMEAEGASLAQDTALFKKIFETEYEDNADLSRVLEDLSLYWDDDLPYALGCVIRSLDQVRRSGRWEFPPLYQSEILAAQGKKVDSDKQFVSNLLRYSYGHFDEYLKEVALTVSKWESDRLYATDLVLIAMGLAEAEFFPEIPVKVSINEYVEIAKYYSTPKSRSFVNGLLDRLIKAHAAEGRIQKINLTNPNE